MDAVSVVVMIATGGIALASGASTGRSIHGCVSALTGVLRIAQHCRADESAISWNQRGPAGPPGLTGPPGSPGPAGRPGDPPHAVTDHDSAEVHLGFAATDVISSPSMLPGDSGGTSYVLSASVDIMAPGVDGAQVSVTCELSLGGATVESTVQFPSVGFAAEGPVYLSLEATISAPRSDAHLQPKLSEPRRCRQGERLSQRYSGHSVPRLTPGAVISRAA